MANLVYGKAKEALFYGEINFASKNVRLLIIDTSLYTVSQNSDQFVSDIPAAAIKQRSGNLLNLSCSLGTVDADDVIISDYSGEAFRSCSWISSWNFRF